MTKLELGLLMSLGIMVFISSRYTKNCDNYSCCKFKLLAIGGVFLSSVIASILPI